MELSGAVKNKQSLFTNWQRSRSKLFEFYSKLYFGSELESMFKGIRRQIPAQFEGDKALNPLGLTYLLLEVMVTLSGFKEVPANAPGRGLVLSPQRECGHVIIQ